MTRTLLLVFAGGLAVCVTSFSAMQVFGADSWPLGHDLHRADSATITRNLAWTGTEGVHIGASSDITYTQGPVAKFTVTGPADVVNALSLDGDTLRSEYGHHWDFGDHDRLTITITSPHTHIFGLSGSHRLTLVQYDQDDLDLHLSGSSTVTGTGKAKHAELRVSGSGRIDMGKLPVDDAQIHISGSGSAILDPKQSADVRISGSGHINLLNRPAKLYSSISGSGAVVTP